VLTWLYQAHFRKPKNKQIICLAEYSMYFWLVLPNFSKRLVLGRLTNFRALMSMFCCDIVTSCDDVVEPVRCHGVADVIVMAPRHSGALQQTQRTAAHQIDSLAACSQSCRHLYLCLYMHAPLGMTSSYTLYYKLS